jgi:hypothetical protein
MKRLWLIPTVLIATLVPAMARSEEAGFNGVVRTLEDHYHVRATRIPFLGLMSFVARKSTHDGVSDLHIAEIEHFSAPLDGDELNRIVEDKLGAGWERIIRETANGGREQTLIFIHPEGERMGMFVLEADGSEINVVQVSVDPKHLDDDIGHYRHHGRNGQDASPDASPNGSGESD